MVGHAVVSPLSHLTPRVQLGRRKTLQHTLPFSADEQRNLPSLILKVTCHSMVLRPSHIIVLVYYLLSSISSGNGSQAPAPAYFTILLLFK